MLDIFADSMRLIVLSASGIDLLALITQGVFASMSQRKSIQAILKRRQQGDFVGRESELTSFQTNLALPPLDDRRRFLVNVYGQGGVGKTWLLRRYREALEDLNGICIYDLTPEMRLWRTFGAAWLVSIKEEGEAGPAGVV